MFDAMQVSSWLRHCIVRRIKGINLENIVSYVVFDHFTGNRN